MDSNQIKSSEFHQSSYNIVMGTTQPKSNLNLKTVDLEIMLNKLIQHLILARDRKLNEIALKEQELRTAMTIGWKTDKDVFFDIVDLVNSVKHVKAITIITSHCPLLRNNSMRIVDALKSNKLSKISDLEPILQNLIWTSVRLDLVCLHEFTNFVKNNFGAGILKEIQRFDKIHKELLECFSKAEPDPVEIIVYLEAFTERQQISQLIADHKSHISIKQQTVIGVNNNNSVLTPLQSQSVNIEFTPYDSNEDSIQRQQSQNQMINDPKSQSSYKNSKYSVQPLSFVVNYKTEINKGHDQPTFDAPKSLPQPIHLLTTISPQPVISIINTQVDSNRTELGVIDNYLAAMIESNLNKSSFRSYVSRSVKQEKVKGQEIYDKSDVRGIVEPDIEDLVAKLKEIGVVLYHENSVQLEYSAQQYYMELSKSYANDYKIEFNSGDGN